MSLYAKESQILIINSYHKGFQWSDDILRGVEKVLYNHPNITTNILYMDSKRISSELYHAKLRELYALQLQNRHYDLVVAVDNFAYDFLLKYYHELFSDEPLFFSGLEKFDLEEILEKGLQDRIYGLLEKRAIDENIELVLKTIPSLKKLYIVNDASANGDDTDSFIRTALAKYGKNIEIEYIRNSTIEELDEYFSKHRADEALLFIRFYNGQDGSFYKNSQIASMIDSSNLPVFVTDTLFIGKGALGGKLVPIQELGEKTGERILDILSAKILPLTITTDENYITQFDDKKLKQFNLTINPNLTNYTIVNTPLDFFDKHRKFIDIIFISSPLLVLLILGLIHNIYMRARNEKKYLAIQEQKNKHQQFIIQQAKLAELGEIFSSVAHQWKSPLVEISTIAQEHVYTCKDQPSEKSNQYVKDIMVQVKYMTETINDFQKFIMPSSKKTLFDMAEAVDSMIKIIDHTICYNYINLKVKKHTKEPMFINGYKNEFMQTLLNIVNNAKDQINYAKERGDIKEGKITITISKKNNLAILSIADNGGGIPEEKLPFIFDAYFSTKKDGHGVGLYMTKLIIEEKMGGKIYAQNTPIGAYFNIQIGCTNENSNS